MKLKIIFHLLFLSQVLNYRTFHQVNSVISLPQTDETLICLFFKPKPPVENNGGSRFAEPPQNPDQFPVPSPQKRELLEAERA